MLEVFLFSRSLVIASKARYNDKRSWIKQAFAVLMAREIAKYGNSILKKV